MKIYCLGLNESLMAAAEVSGADIPFAFFSALGTWTYVREPCGACGWHWQDLVAPLLVQWEPSTDVIGDFSWDGPYGYIFVVKACVADFLREKQFECEFLDVDFVPPERTPKGIKCVAYPYEGPQVFWAECKTFVDLDMEASGVELESSCDVCGDVRYTFRYKGIVIRRRDWHGEKMFRITTNGRSAATFMTEEGRGLIESAGFSNLSFTVAGEIVR